jgi:HlyD family secretion protein
MSVPSSSLRRRASDVDHSFGSRRSAAGHDIGDTRSALVGVVEDAQHATELVTELERELELLRKLSEAKVVVDLVDSRVSPNYRRRWTGLGLIAVALLTTFGLSAANRAAVSQDGLAQLEGTEFTGTIVPSQQFAVNAVVSGTVRRVLVAVGDNVTAGQPLIEVDDHSVRSALDAALVDHRHATDEAEHWQRRLAALDQSIAEINTAFAQSLGAVALAQRSAEQIPGRQLRDSPERAQAAFDQATSRLQRLQRLHAQGLVSDEALEDQTIAVRLAKNDLENANQWRTASAELQRAQQEQARQQTARTKADLQQQRGDYQGRLEQAQGRADQAMQRVRAARSALEEAVVKAATAGVVVDVAVEVGDRPAAGAPLVSIARLNELVVEVPVASTLVNVLRPGQDATVVLPTVPKEYVAGRIGTINPIPAANMTHRVEVEFANPSGRLLSGQPAQVVFR